MLCARVLPCPQAYCFEGTGLVLPLESSCARPSRFPALLVTTLFAITVLEVSFGALGCLAYGSEVAQAITLNMPKGAGTLVIKTCLCLG